MHQTEKIFEEHGSNLSNEDKQSIDNALKDAKVALEADDVVQMNTAQETLQTVTYKISEAMYANQQSAEGPPVQDVQDGDDVIIDAEAV